MATPTSWRALCSSTCSVIAGVIVQRPVELLAVGVHAHDVARPELVPREAERIDQEGAVRLLVGDVAGEVVVVALGEQAAASSASSCAGVSSGRAGALGLVTFMAFICVGLPLSACHVVHLRSRMLWSRGP